MGNRALVLCVIGWELPRSSSSSRKRGLQCLAPALSTNFSTWNPEIQFLVTTAVTLLHRILFRQSLLIFSGAWGTLRLLLV